MVVDKKALSPPAGITVIALPLRRPSRFRHARTVLAGKGSLRRAKTRRALAGCAPFRPETDTTGGSGGNTIRRFTSPSKPELLTLLETGTFHFALTITQMSQRHQ
jgi:hypothetical protein